MCVAQGATCLCMTISVGTFRLLALPVRRGMAPLARGSLLRLRSGLLHCCARTGIYIYRTWLPSVFACQCAFAVSAAQKLLFDKNCFLFVAAVGCRAGRTPPAAPVRPSTLVYTYVSNIALMYRRWLVAGRKHSSHMRVWCKALFWRPQRRAGSALEVVVRGRTDT